MNRKDSASIQTNQFAEFAAAVTQQLPRDIDLITAQKWITERDALRIALREALVPPSARRIQYQLRMDYNIPLQKLIEAGQYENVRYACEEKAESEASAEETSMDKYTGKVLDVTAELVCFERNISLDEAKKIVTTLGFKNADYRALLSFGAQYPDVQREFRIIGLNATTLKSMPGIGNTLDSYVTYGLLTQEKNGRKVDSFLEHEDLKPKDRVLVIT